MGIRKMTQADIASIPVLVKTMKMAEIAAKFSVREAWIKRRIKRLRTAGVVVQFGRHARYKAVI